MPKITRPKSYLKWRLSTGGTIEVVDIAVNSERCKGVGTSMMKELFAIARDMDIHRVYAITRSANRVAQKFYESLNMEANAIMRLYPDDDAYIYVKLL